MSSSLLSLQNISLYDDEDEVVLLSFEDNDNDNGDDDDFVFLDRSCPCMSDTADAEQVLPEAGVTSETLNPETTDEAAEIPPLTPSPPPSRKKERSPKEKIPTLKQQPQKKCRKKSSKQRKKANKAAASPVLSEIAPTSTRGGAAATPEEMYKEASQFITSFLANPAAKKDSVCRLTLLQSLIVELGLASTALPTSLRSARAFLKARVFINIGEYLAHRGKDQAALQKLLYPSKTALVKDIRKHKRKTARSWVKEHGLNVLLVKCFHH